MCTIHHIRIIILLSKVGKGDDFSRQLTKKREHPTERNKDARIRAVIKTKRLEEEENQMQGVEPQPSAYDILYGTY
jgi:hypothetical protein